MNYCIKNITVKFFLTAFSAFIMLFSFCQTWEKQLPATTLKLVQTSLQKAGTNKTELIKALQQAPKNHLKAVAFLIGYMPQVDRQGLTASFILENTELGFRARQNFVWCRSLPDSVFFNEVLPYAVLNERRDNWRQDFYNRFAPLAVNCKNIYAAIDSVNRNIAKNLKVEYNTKRRKTDQSPYESMEQGMATCTGLSILLVDAFRAVGIPSRLAGTPNWTTKEGNHNWVEVFVDGKWYFTEYYPEALNKSWFVADAGKADENSPAHSIYATSFKPATTWFRCVWDTTLRYIPATNVTKRYIDIYNKQMMTNKAANNEMLLNIVLYKDETCTPTGNNRVQTKIFLLKDNEQIATGLSPSPTDDMNKYLVFKVLKNTNYKLQFFTSLGQVISKEITTGDDKEMVHRLYLK